MATVVPPRGGFNACAFSGIPTFDGNLYTAMSEILYDFTGFVSLAFTV